MLRAVKYGETSVIAAVYTERFGLQSYLLSGVRTAPSKGGKGNILQPAALLDMVVYHNELKAMHRVREFRYAQVYRQIFQHVFRNAVALFMVELMLKTLKQPEPNPELYHFAESSFILLDQGEDRIVANFPLYFALQLSVHFGFGLARRHPEGPCFLDLQEGRYVSESPAHPHFLEGALCEAMAAAGRCRDASMMAELPLNRQTRRRLLHAMETFYALHVADFGTMRTLPVLETVLD